MPLVRVSVGASRSAEDRGHIAQAIYEAMRATIGIPEGDKFIVVTPHGPAELFVDAGFMGMRRQRRFHSRADFSQPGAHGRAETGPLCTYRAGLQSAVGVSPDDVMTVLAENTYVDWSFGRGEAQFVLNPPAWVKQAKKE